MQLFFDPIGVKNSVLYYISLIFGIEGCAPFRVTEIAAALFARVMASLKLLPAANKLAK